MDLDTNWCPICDRLITPERITLPSSDEVATKLPGQIPKPKPVGVRPSHARRLTGGHTRSGSKSGSKPMGIDLLTTQVAVAPAKPRTAISQTPTALYCSESCREKDQLSSERFQLCLETMYSGPPSASSLSSPLFVSGSESASDADVDALTNESYFAKLRIHGGEKALRQMRGGPDRDSWADRRHSAGATTPSSSEDLPTSSPATTLPPPTPTSSSSYGRHTSSSLHGRSKSVYDGNAALYAAYPLTFHRTRSGEGVSRSRKNSYSSLCGTSVESASNQPNAKPTDIQSSQTTDTTPTQSPYGIDAVSAQGLLVRPALLRAKTERTGLSPLSPISPAVSDSAPRLYPPAYGSSLPASKHGFAPKSRPSSPTRTPFARKPEFRRRSEVLSQDLLNESSRTRSYDQIANKPNFLPMYPALPTPTPTTRKVKTWVVEGERLVEKEVVEECREERKRMFHFNTEVS